MVIISYRPIRAYFEVHPQAKDALLDWYEKTEEANWNTVTDVHSTFNSADSIGGERFVFNIRGNHYRLVAAISFKTRTVYVKFIGTHDEYDAINVHTIDQF
jgi:mRNA interferase HigB